MRWRRSRPTKGDVVNRSKMVGIVAVAVVATALAGCNSAAKKPAIREIAVQVTENGFEPREPQVAKGENVVLVVTRKTDLTCAKAITVKDRNLNAELPLNQPVRLALGRVNETVAFTCAMDMIDGQLVVK